MNIPFLDLKAQYTKIKNEILPEINDVLDNTAYILGKKVQNFESAFATAHECKYCYGVGTGTAGNHTVLWALGVGPGDEVIIPANTFIATAWGATLCGAKPVFVDCHSESYNIDPEKIEFAITSKTKAIVAVHLYGQPANMDSLNLLADRNNLFLVEDCAQAHISQYNRKPIGGFGIASSFSFYPGKNLGAFGEGGAVMTNDEQLAKKFKMIRDHGTEQKYIHQIFGHNYRMEAIQGAVLGVKLKHLAQWTNERRRVATKYRELLSSVEQIKLPKEMDYAKHVYHLFVVQVKSQKSEVRSQKRDELQKFLYDNGISTGLHYPIPLHLQPCFEHLEYKEGDFPVAEELAEQGLSLPMYPELANDQIEYVCNSIKKFFDNN
jgi:dTDP-4-amino-4,6-dideoxygalactose transaminase